MSAPPQPTFHPVPRESSQSTPIPTHHTVPVLAIGGLSLALVLGLHALGVIERANQWIAAAVSRDGLEDFPKSLPPLAIWLATAAFPCLLAAAMLAIPCQSRRMILWISSLIVTAAWAPVLSLASHSPDIAAPWIATAWAGFCATIHAMHETSRTLKNTPHKP